MRFAKLQAADKAKIHVGADFLLIQCPWLPLRCHPEIIQTKNRVQSFHNLMFYLDICYQDLTCWIPSIKELCRPTHHNNPRLNTVHVLYTEKSVKIIVELTKFFKLALFRFLLWQLLPFFL